jgi:molecular chaperone DnaK
MSRVLGIDLGTTNSCVAVIDNGTPLVVPCDGDRYVLPSVVAFVEDGRHLVGRTAKRQSVVNAENTIVAVKRLMGLSFGDPRAKQAMATVSYACVEGPNGDVRVSVQGRSLAVAEVSALILAELKRAAEAHFNERLERAVIAVPAHFNDYQRQATRDAGRIAGLEVARILNEPTAAALAYGALQHGARRRVVVYDLGGGTFDVSVLELEGDNIDVRATAGDAFLGGRDFDKRIVDWAIGRVEVDHGVSLSGDRNAMQRLWEAAEGAKVDLSDHSSTKITLPFLTQKGDTPVHADYLFERYVFEKLTADLVERTVMLFLDTVRAAGLRPSELDEVILVGGMTRMPLVNRRVQEVLGKAPSSGVHPDLVVAVGAAIQGDILAQAETPTPPKTVLHDVTPHNLGIRSLAGLAETVIPKDSPIPVTAHKVFTTVTDNQQVVRIVVFQGDSRQMEDNQVLGEFVLAGIRPAPRGAVQIDVSFQISPDGIVSVSAKDLETGRAQAIEIRERHTLPEAELQHMIESHKQQMSDQVVPA